MGPQVELQAAGWGALAASGLLMGAVGGYYAPFSHSAISRAMTFAAGVLLAVVAVELVINACGASSLHWTVMGLLSGAAVFSSHESNSSLLKGLDRFSQRAHDILVSPRAARAFDISQESAAIAKFFPEDTLAQSCLLGMRLVEAGVRFVSIDHGGWDTHDKMFPQLKDRLLPELDGALAGLLAALDTKGLLATTAVFVTGEFGRTPKISSDRAGRDHYPRAMFVLLAGGGMKGGQVIGASDARGEAPMDGKGMSPDDVATNLYHSLGSTLGRSTELRPAALSRWFATEQ